VTTAESPEVRVTRGPNPDPEELAAIVAAVQVVLGSGDGGPEAEPPVPRWRFSGRWWSRPVPARRDRPAAF
jgi:hypothetical protein